MSETTCPACGAKIVLTEAGLPLEFVGSERPKGPTKQQVILNKGWKLAFKFQPVPTNWMDVADACEVPWCEEWMTKENLLKCKRAQGQFFGPNNFLKWVRDRVEKPVEVAPQLVSPETLFTRLPVEERAVWIAQARESHPGMPAVNEAVKLWLASKETPHD